jgi:hypothetical protein
VPCQHVRSLPQLLLSLQAADHTTHLSHPALASSPCPSSRCSLQVDPTPSSINFLGVSPPVRSGASNPLVHDSSWRRIAPLACKSNLRALAELDGGGGLPFLSGNTSCQGDYSLLVTSPDSSASFLAALEADEQQQHQVVYAPYPLTRCSPAAAASWCASASPPGPGVLVGEHA